MRCQNPVKGGMINMKEKSRNTTRSLKDISFNDLYNEHWKLLYEVAYAKTGSRQDALDIVQDLFVRIWENRQNIAVPDSLKAYLLTSLRNKIFDHFRKNIVSQKVVQDFSRFSEEAIISEVEVAAIESMREDTMKTIRQAIDDLPEKMRYIVQQRWYHKKTIADLSEELRVSHKTIKNNLSLALQRIRQNVDENVIDIVFLLIVIYNLP